MVGLFVGHAQPVFVKRGGHAVKAPDGVERQVDGVEFDVANRMEQGGEAFVGEGLARGHLLRRFEHGASGASGQDVARLTRRRVCRAQGGQGACVPQGVDGLDFGQRVAKP